MFDRRWLLAAASTGFVAAAIAQAAPPAGSTGSADDTLDGRVVQVTLPFDDVTLRLLETRGGLTLELQASQVSIVGPKLFIGDGRQAVEMQVDFRRGCVVKNGPVLNHGFVFKKSSTFALPPDSVRAAELRPGDVYVILPGVQFKAAAP